MVSLACIKPNAEKNVKSVLQDVGPWAGSLPIRIGLLFICAFLPEPLIHAADDPISSLEGTNEPPTPVPASTPLVETTVPLAPTAEVPGPPSSDVEAPNLPPSGTETPGLPPSEAPPGSIPDAPALPMQEVPPLSMPNSLPGKAPEASRNADTWTTDETNLPIRASKFTVQVLNHSTSGRVYLLQFLGTIIPKPGEILLLKIVAEPVMAFRVLKVTPAASTLVGQVIKKYGNRLELQFGERYDAIIKIGEVEGISDIINAPEAEFEDPTWNTSEIEPTILPYDPELDIGSMSPAEVAEKAKDIPVTPLSALESKVAFLESKVVTLETKVTANKIEIERIPAEVEKTSTAPISKNSPGNDGTGGQSKSDESTEKPPEKLDNDLLEKDDPVTTSESMSVEEVKLFDNYAHWLSAGFGYITNNAPNGQGIYNFSAGNLKYGVTIGRRVVFDRPHLQDSLVLEGGIYVYKGINFAAQGDSYTVFSMAANLRYNLFFSEGFGLFGYAGMLQSNVLASASPVASALTALNSVLPSFGAGFLIQIGPSWYARLDVGFDNTSLNLLLRF